MAVPILTQEQDLNYLKDIGYTHWTDTAEKYNSLSARLLPDFAMRPGRIVVFTIGTESGQISAFSGKWVVYEVVHVRRNKAVSDHKGTKPVMQLQTMIGGFRRGSNRGAVEAQGVDVSRVYSTDRYPDGEYFQEPETILVSKELD